MKIVFLFLASLAVVAVVGAWIVMIVAGAVHHEVPSLSRVILPWSLRESFWISVGLTVFGSFFKNYSTSRN